MNPAFKNSSLNGCYNILVKIKIISLNIWRGKVLDNAVSFFKKENPDIINLQEVYDGKNISLSKNYRTFEYLKETFPEYNSVFGAQFCDITPLGNIEEGNAIFSKFPIISFEKTFFDIPYGTFDNHAKTSFEDNPQSTLHAEVDLGGKKLNIFNVHGIWGIDGLDSKRRHKMVDVILDKIEGKESVILAGDFNMSADTAGIRRIERKLTSVFGTTLINTFNMKRKKNPGYATAAVDMIFVSPNIKILEKKCPEIDVSNHLPLITELEV